jgi:hypothetical protein
MPNRVCLSDLHLGDSRSLLTIKENAVEIANFIYRIVQSDRKENVLDSLVLNGDIWEECVPHDIGQNTGVFNTAVFEASQAFFGPLFQAIDVKEVVIIPGNHDLSLWAMVERAGNNAAPLVTSYEGVQLYGSNAYAVYTSLLNTPNPFYGLRLAYPLYCPKPANPDDDFPMLAFTHGHLLDPLVRGLSTEAEYDFLKALGANRPRLPSVLEKVTSIKQVAQNTDEFTLSLWRRYSKRDYIYSNYIMRRMLHPQSCPVRLLPGMSPIMYGTDVCSPRDSRMQDVPWFLELALMDPELPTPVGSLRPNIPVAAFTKPSCFVFGHDHLGPAQTIMVYGVPFHVFDSGGWTSEFEGHVPHSHVLYWSDGDVVPQTYYLRPSVKVA